VNSKIDRIDNLLNQFGYNQSSKCGFMFFIGGSMLIPSSNEEQDSLLTAQKQLKKFDNSEDLDAVYGRLLGQVKDLYIQSFFEELIWRLDAGIEPRKSTVPGTDITVSEFTFKNNKLLKSDDSKIKKLFDAESCLNTVFEGVGTELLTQDHDLTQCYEAGAAFFTLKAHVDRQCTIQMIALIRRLLSPTLKSIETIARVPVDIYDGYLVIQLALHSLISFDEEFSQTLWAFQSYVLYEKQKEIPGIAELPIEEFMKHCSLRAAHFFNVNREAMISIANKRVHMAMSPRLQNGIDERSSLIDAIQNEFGVPEKNTPHSDINFKAVIIFAYFSVICETTLSSSEEIKIQ
jgi:hypothetical protein